MSARANRCVGGSRSASVAGLVAVLGIQFFALHLLIRHEFYSNLDEELLSRLRAVAVYVADHPGRESVAEFMPQYRTP